MPKQFVTRASKSERRRAIRVLKDAGFNAATVSRLLGGVVRSFNPRPRRSDDRKTLAAISAIEKRLLAELESRGYQVTAREIRSPASSRRVAMARFALFFCCRTLMGSEAPFELLGAVWWRDHSTVFYGVRKIAELLEAGDDEALDERLAGAIRTVVGPLRARPSAGSEEARPAL